MQASPEEFPKGQASGATIGSAVNGNGTTDTRGTVQAALNSCPDGKVGYMLEETYTVIDTIHLYDYYTLMSAWQYNP